MGILLAGCLCVSPSLFGQEAPQSSSAPGGIQKGPERMESGATVRSLTVLPILLAGRPYDRVSEVVGVLLEQQGLENIEVGATPFVPAAGIGMEQLSALLSEFLKKNPVPTKYALYAEYNGDRQTGLVELRGILVNTSGKVVWMESLGDQDTALQQLESREPMTFSVLLSERLCPVLGLNEETAKAAKPGRMARRMEERSGLPPESERALLPERQKLLKESRETITLGVFPIRIGGEADTTSAIQLASMIRSADLCKSTPTAKSLSLRSSQADPNEMKVLWDLAREFRVYCRKNPVTTDYVLYADYIFNPERWEQGYVHFVVCDRNGEWVIVDHAEFTPT